MGCDGGTIPKRDELVRVKKKPEQKDKDAELSFKWRHCALSQQTLEAPIVACGLGRLYSKSAVLESLLDKSNMPESMKHIRNMKDIKDLNLTKNPAYDKNAEKTDGAIDDRGSPYICPIIGLEMSGRFRFVFLWSCGCVISERSLKEIKMNVCHLCQKPFTENDVIVINGSEDDIIKLKEKLAIRQLAQKSDKKNKSSKKETVDAVPSCSTTNCDSNDSKDTNDVLSDPKNTNDGESSSSKSNVLKIPLELPKARKNPGSCSVMRPHKRQASDNAMQDPVYKKTKEEYSVAKDPKASDVFKSIFTSHQSDKDQKRAHWITYNPFYN